MPVGVEQDVGRLDVAVHEPARVRRVERGRDLAHDLQRALGSEWGERAAQVAALDERIAR